MNDVVTLQNLLPSYEKPLTALDIRSQVNVIQEVLRDVMKDGVHYGFPPGTEPKNDEERKLKKPSLLKPGAELLCVVFRFDPQYEVERTRLPGGHLEVVSTANLFYIPNGRRVGSGMGSATTEESKHAYRWAARTCPVCGVPAIIKGRKDWGGGWLCFDKKGGCKAKFNDEDAEIVNQEVGRIANPDMADQYNTVLKISNKRALTASVLTATAASDMFHQDLEDLNPETEWTDNDGVVHQGERPKESVKGAASKSEKKPGEQDAKPLSDGAKKTLKASLQRANRTEADLAAAGFPKIDAMSFGKFNEAMDWIKKNPAA